MTADGQLIRQCTVAAAEQLIIDDQSKSGSETPPAAPVAPGWREAMSSASSVKMH